MPAWVNLGEFGRRKAKRRKEATALVARYGTATARFAAMLSRRLGGGGLVGQLEQYVHDADSALGPHFRGLNDPFGDPLNPRFMAAVTTVSLWVYRIEVTRCRMVHSAAVLNNWQQALQGIEPALYCSRLVAWKWLLSQLFSAQVCTPALPSGSSLKS